MDGMGDESTSMMAWPTISCDALPHTAQFFGPTQWTPIHPELPGNTRQAQDQRGSSR